MLIEIWERLRGYDKWIPVEARVYSTSEIRKKLGKRYHASPSSQFSGELLVWQDQRGETRFGTFLTHETSPLYQLVEGEPIAIRYNPAKPGRYYCRPHFTACCGLIAKWIFMGTIGLGFIAWRIWMIFKHRGL